MAKDEKDAKARKSRAADLRASIRRLSEGGGVPGKQPSPREITDEAARKAKAKAERKR